MKPARTKLLLGLVAAGLTADAVRRRKRLAGLPTLPETADPVAENHRFVTAEGVRIDAATRRAASAYAQREGLDVVDLVPAGLDAASALDLARRYDPGSYRAARLALGVGAGHALLATEDVLQRAGITKTENLDAVEIAEVTARIKRFAAVTTDLAVAPGLDAVDGTHAARSATVRKNWRENTPALLTGQFLAAAALAAATKKHPRWGLAALTAWCLQPYLTTAGTPLSPHDGRRFAALRPAIAPYRWLRVATSGDPYHPDLSRLREAYGAELAQGTDRFLEAPRTTCPWCDGPDLRKLVVSKDYQQQKPGTFQLDRCDSCGHVFQNPRLTFAGLDFYYRDYYDGLGADEVERGWRMAGPVYRDRANMVRPFTEPIGPKAWLDIGGGHGHFCNIAKEVWPDTRFDGLDMSESIEEAERRRWIDLGHRGQFPDLAGELAGAYDVVSMHHYLEHVVDPKAELDAAARVLPPGGFLLIEVPDPESPFGRVFGRWWFNWFQPQHLHFIPLGNLKDALADRGLETVAVDRGSVHAALDTTMTVLLMLNRLAPDPDKPWNDLSHPRLRRAWRAATYVAGVPALAGAVVADQVIARAVPRTGGSNCYRILARKPD